MSILSDIFDSSAQNLPLQQHRPCRDQQRAQMALNQYNRAFLDNVKPKSGIQKLSDWAEKDLGFSKAQIRRISQIALLTAYKELHK